MSRALTDNIPNNTIYTGVWTNWSKGYVRGATITLTKSEGAILTAFIALYVTLIGASFWRLFCFATHQALSAKTAQDGLYHQRQAALRNAAEGTVGLQYFVQLAWTWRKKTSRLWVRITPLIIATVVLTAGFYLASIFSSQISTAMADEVLINGSKCGPLRSTPNSLETSFNTVLPYTSKLTTTSVAYARQCYGDNAAAQECSTFIQKQILQNVYTNASCPFPGKDRICLRNSTNIRIDTGKIDSHEHLGINTAPNGRFSYRKILECAPLQLNNYTRKVDSDSELGSRVQWLYGRQKAAGQKAGPYRNDSVTFEWTLYASKILHEYSLMTMNYESGTIASFYPISDLLRNDASITLIFLMANLIGSLRPVDDDLFAAHVPVNMSQQAGEGTVLYQSDGIGHVLGCTTQVQFCMSEARCTPLSIWQPAFEAAQNLSVTDQQKESLKAFSTSARAFNLEIAGIIQTLGASALIARDNYQGVIQGPLPPNQWQLEVAHWSAITMAGLQRAVVDYATGYSGSPVESYVARPSNNEAKSLCRSQKMRSSSHTSFSLLGLGITFILGGAILLLQLNAECILRSIQRRRNVGLYQRLEWITNETLQLQRMAHEELGAGTWSGTADDIPTTGKNEQLATLDVSDSAHPRLVFGQAAKKGVLAMNARDGLYPSFTQVTRARSQAPRNQDSSLGSLSSFPSQTSTSDNSSVPDVQNGARQPQPIPHSPPKHNQQVNFSATRYHVLAEDLSDHRHHGSPKRDCISGLQ